MRPIFFASNYSVHTLTRLCIAGTALLFALSAILGTLPDYKSVEQKLSNAALTGYAQVSITTPHRQPILEEYYDYLPSDTAVTSQEP